MSYVYEKLYMSARFWHQDVRVSHLQNSIRTFVFEKAKTSTWHCLLCSPKSCLIFFHDDYLWRRPTSRCGSRWCIPSVALVWLVWRSTWGEGGEVILETVFCHFLFIYTVLPEGRKLNLFWSIYFYRPWILWTCFALHYLFTVLAWIVKKCTDWGTD